MKEIKSLTEREKEVLALIKDDARISREEIAAELEISESAVGTYIHHLTNKGYLLGRGYITAPEEKIVVVGGANLDIKGYSPNYIKGSSSPGWIKESSGGVGRNIAEDLALLGQEVVLLTAVSNDHFGLKVQQQTEEAGVNISHFKTLSAVEQKTGVYLAHLDQKGDLIGAVNDMSILKEIDIEYLQEKRKIIETAAMLIFDTNLEEAVISKLLDLSGNHQTLKIVDTVSVEKSLKLKGKLEKLDYLRSNLDEVEVLLDLVELGQAEENNHLSSEKRIKKIKKEFVDNSRLPELIISAGADGVYYLGRTGEEIIFKYFKAEEIKKEEIVETTGAGDALTAAFAAALINEKTVAEAVKLGIKAATLTIKSELTCNPALTDLKL